MVFSTPADRHSSLKTDTFSNTASKSEIIFPENGESYNFLAQNTLKKQLHAAYGREIAYSKIGGGVRGDYAFARMNVRVNFNTKKKHVAQGVSRKNIHFFSS